MDRTWLVLGFFMIVVGIPVIMGVLGDMYKRRLKLRGFYPAGKTWRDLHRLPPGCTGRDASDVLRQQVEHAAVPRRAAECRHDLVAELDVPGA